MTVGMICSRSADTTFLEDSIQTAAQRMLDRNVGTLIVVTAGDEPIGMVTDRDLALRVIGQARDPLTTTVGDVMTRSPRTIRDDADVDEALRLMRAGSCRRLPVVDRSGVLAGLISLDDVLQFLASEFRGIDRLLQRESPEGLANARCTL